MSEAYTFPELPLAPVRAGRTLLVEGATVDGVGAFVHRATDPGDGEGAILVGTNATGRRLLDTRRNAGSEADGPVYVVDCVSQQQGTTVDEPTVEGVSSPADLTGIGIRISGFYRRLAAEDIERVRVGLLSVSTLLMYADLRRVSRFVHVLTGRVASTDGVGLLALDSSAHEDQTVGTIRQLCDGRVEVRSGDEGREVRIRGLRDQPEGWTPMD
jgi:hypothetical protein